MQATPSAAIAAQPQPVPASGTHGARVTVLVQPEEPACSLPRPKTARQLLEVLGLAEETALVAREGQLLTPDRRVWPGDNLLVRKVTSSG